LHRHKGVGEFMLLRSTVELAQVLVSSSDERCGKVTELSSLANTGKPNRPRKTQRRQDVIATSNEWTVSPKREMIHLRLSLLYTL
jgi:hypothetical protein